MRFSLADTYFDSLTKLQPKEQSAANRSVQKFYKNEAQSGLNLEKLHQAQDKNFHSIRVSRDIRIILYKRDDLYVLCHIGHHDAAYQWANRRKMEAHPKTGAAQIIELRERVENIPAPPAAEQLAAEQLAAEQPPEPFQHGAFLKLTEEDLLKIGVPREYLFDVHNATEDSFFQYEDNLPAEAMEALIDYIITGNLKIPDPAAPGTDPFDHPDARRRFYMVEDEADLARILEIPWEQWLLFLHPSQREYVEADYAGPVRIAGVAGTGKTIVALHRAAYLAHKNPGAKILLTTFLHPLINDLSKRMDDLIGHQPDIRKRIIIRSLTDIAKDLYQKIFGKINVIDEADHNKINAVETIASSNKVSAMLHALAGEKIPMSLLRPEWYNVADAWGARSLEDYLRAPRLGRMTKPSHQQYEDFWIIFQQLRAQLKAQGIITRADMFNRLTDHFRKEKSPFDFILVDESQDLYPPQMQLLGALAGSRSNGLFFCGDLGQRIYEQPFSWKSCGVDIGKRLYILHKNYRTSRQIQKQTARLLPSSLADVDGQRETREGNFSVFNGPKPAIQTFDDEQKENDFIIQWLKQRIKEGVAPNEIAIFIRYIEFFERIECILNTVDQNIVFETMQNAKGLEFRAVVLMSCNDGIVPSQERLDRYSNDLGIDEIYSTERQMLYVAATRAREHLLITGVKPVSEFLSDLAG